MKIPFKSATHPALCSGRWALSKACPVAVWRVPSQYVWDFSSVLALGKKEIGTGLQLTHSRIPTCSLNHKATPLLWDLSFLMPFSTFTGTKMLSLSKWLVLSFFTAVFLLCAVCISKAVKMELRKKAASCKLLKSSYNREMLVLSLTLRISEH